MANPDKQALHDFLWTSYTTVDEILKVDILFEVTLPFVSQAKDAWKGTKEKIIAVKEFVLNSSGELDEMLLRYGLMGDDLRFKLNVFSALRERFVTLRESVNARLGDAVQALRRVVSRLLDVMDTILDSLAAIFSVLESVTEVKDTIKSMIAD
jgi:hypothetical protein